ncbi:Hypothetical predicted protein, partial [Paramuricea clavata]
MYSAFDKELLALSAAVQHFRYVIEGQAITVRTDHKPLVSALVKPSDNLSALQRRHLSKISQIVDRIEYQSGESNVLADAFSRIDIQEVLEDDPDEDKQFSSAVVAPIVPHIKALSSAQRSDPQLQEWIERHHGDGTIHQPQLVDFKGEQIWCNALRKILVPTSLQRQIFHTFHDVGHPGIKGSTRLITENHYWPKIKGDISSWV